MYSLARKEYYSTREPLDIHRNGLLLQCGSMSSPVATALVATPLDNELSKQTLNHRATVNTMVDQVPHRLVSYVPGAIFATVNRQQANKQTTQPARQVDATFDATKATISPSHSSE